jgi:hypothetical protein
MIKRRLGHLRVAAAAAALIAACAPAVSRNRASDPLPPGFDARTVEIHYQWRGMPGSPQVSRKVRLQRQGDTYTSTGTSELALRSMEGGRIAGPLAVTVPDSAMRAFLRALAAAPRRRGRYVPFFSHTDDYPETTITLRSDAGAVVEFYNSSQATHPWRVTVGGQRYVCDTAAPFEAERHLLPFVHYQELNRAVEGQRQAKP